MNSNSMNDRLTILIGDCREKLREIPNASVDSCVTDPPYLLNFMGKEWDTVRDGPMIDSDTGNWLAGFADGEACFTSRKSGKGYVCEFIIHLRADDEPILRSLQRITGIGDIRGPQDRGDKGAPMMKWIVSRQSDCAKLIAIFDAFPLRAKKARDFAIWRETVKEWIAHEPGTSWETIAIMAEQLSAVKKYGASFNKDQFFHFQWAREVFRVLKPGGHLLAFGGTRTFHRLAAGIEDAGFEIRDQMGWVYSSGFPKSHNLDNLKGDQFCGCKSTPKHGLPCLPIPDVSTASHAEVREGEILQQEMQEQGSPATGREKLSTSAIRERESRMEGRCDLFQKEGELQEHQIPSRSIVGGSNGERGRIHDGASPSDGGVVRVPSQEGGGGSSPGPQSDEQREGELGIVAEQSKSQTGGAWPYCDRCGKPILPNGLGTALKPAWEPICVARKPLVGTVAANVLQHGTGALNIDGCRVETVDKITCIQGGKSGSGFDVGSSDGTRHTDFIQHQLGRWPANLIHDGSDEVVTLFPQSKDGVAVQRNGGGQKIGGNGIYAGSAGLTRDDAGYGGEGSAARFFYCAKVSPSERGDSDHPTMKPLALMRYLVRLVTPPGGKVLDPFGGSGTTAVAAIEEGFSIVLCELDPSRASLIRRRTDVTPGLGL